MQHSHVSSSKPGVPSGDSLGSVLLEVGSNLGTLEAFPGFSLKVARQLPLNSAKNPSPKCVF